MRAWLGQLPKADLHVHLEGSVPPALALELAKRNDVSLPGAHRGIEGLVEAYTFRNFGDVIRLYKAISRCMSTAEDFQRAVFGVAETFAEAGTAYAEVTFTPMTHLRRGVNADAMLAGLAAGRQAAKEELGVELSWVFDIVRSFPEQSEETLALALRARDQGVVALGIAGPEGERLPTAPFVEVFKRAKAQGLGSVPHAGEQWGAQSVREAIDLLHADRIGHGVRAIEDPALVQELVARGVKLEVCPSSNLTLGIYSDISEHPVHQLAEAGVAISLGSDDPALFQCDLVGEYMLMHDHFGWNASRLYELACAAVEHSFLPAPSKRDLRERQAALRPA